MSVPSSRTDPDTWAPGIVSCMRFRHRRKVDLPHPEGPMMAVTRRSSKLSDTFLIACTSPKKASRLCTSTRVRDGSGADSAAATRGDAIGTSSVTHSAKSRAGREACGKTDDEDERDEDERSRPGEGVPFVIGADSIVEDLKWKSRNRLVEVHRPELIAERGEEQGSGLPGDARHGDQRASHDTGGRGAEHDGQ